jgi:hypothetical protein
MAKSTIRFAKIEHSLWKDTEFKKVLELGLDYVALALYLRSCQYCNMIGVYFIPIKQAAKTLRQTEVELVKMLKRLEDIGYCVFDEEEERIWVKDMFKMQIGSNVNQKQLAGISSLIEEQASYNCPIIDSFIKVYINHYGLANENTHNTTQPSYQASRFTGIKQGDFAKYNQVEEQKRMDN